VERHGGPPGQATTRQAFADILVANPTDSDHLIDADRLLEWATWPRLTPRRTVETPS
jgi:hypothetical protein